MQGKRDDEEEVDGFGLEVARGQPTGGVIGLGRDVEG